MEIKSKIDNLIKSKGKSKFEKSVTPNKYDKKNKSKSKEKPKIRENINQPLAEVTKAKYGYETGAPPIVVVVHGGKGVRNIMHLILNINIKYLILNTYYS